MVNGLQTFSYLSFDLLLLATLSSTLCAPLSVLRRISVFEAIREGTFACSTGFFGVQKKNRVACGTAGWRQRCEGSFLTIKFVWFNPVRLYLAWAEISVQTLRSYLAHWLAIYHLIKRRLSKYRLHRMTSSLSFLSFLL